MPVPVNSSHEVIVTWQRAGEEQLERFSVFFEYDHPKEGVIGTTTSSGDLDALVQAFQNLPEPERILRVDAYASREAGSAQTTHNNQLSARRAAHLVSLFALKFSQVVARQIWRRRGVFPLQCRAHRLQRRGRFRGLLVPMATISDLLQTARI